MSRYWAPRWARCPKGHKAKPQTRVYNTDGSYYYVNQPTNLAELLAGVGVPEAALLNAIKYLQPFIGKLQLRILAANCRGEEGECFKEMLIALHGHIQRMPITYESRRETDDPLVYLHYFSGSFDWWILEKDADDPDDAENSTPSQSQAYGFVNLGDPQNAECGYISLPEILSSSRVELDLYWQPIPLSKVKEKLYA
jgi:hypothetical protein